ncbi:TrmB family transcriptional regulator [Bacillus sp. BRMEA1]|uniref:TrmB family transcriptional regulator n=1 Tax=Neobacillus endophyticus TaxID=2738405 RepID=UPI001565C05F|nr:TrmB family transcriptional regulator [Neobacillus endophyticus]NRD79492.1 TrmB family transcriptional regulator [Neobacillus endophyticus]
MLQKFGFSQYESKVYEILSASDEPLDATQIVTFSGVPKAKVYEVITKLINKGLILDSVSEKKKFYTALPLNLVIEMLTKEFQENVNQLKNKSYKKSFTDDRVWSLKSDSSIRSQCKELLQEAKHSIRISLWKEDFEDFHQILLDKEQTGVKVEALVVGEVDTKISFVQILQPNEEHQMLEQNRLIIIDDEEILFAGVENDSWQAMKTKSRPIVKFFTEFFYHDVALTKITKRFEETLMKDQEIKELLLRLRY